MAGGGGGTEYYGIYGMAKNPNESNSIFLLLRNFDEDKNQLVKFNSSTGTKTVLVNFATMTVWHMRYYNSKLYVLTRNIGNYWGHIRIYNISGSSLETIDIAALPFVVSESFDVRSPCKIAVYDENNILIIFGGTSRGLLAKKDGGSWDAEYFFANYGDFNNSGLLSIETARNGYFHCAGRKDTTDIVKWYKYSDGSYAYFAETENYISEMYYSG